MNQQVAINFRSLRDLIVCEDSATPAVVRAITPSVPQGQQSTGGPISNAAKPSTYVRLESLPKELAEKVRMAVESMSWG